MYNNIILQFRAQVQTEDEYIDEQIDIADNDSPELSAFLRQAVPLMKRMLEKNMRSRAFDGKFDGKCK